MGIVEAVSVFLGVASIVLAVVATVLSFKASKDAHESHLKTIATLSEIEKRSAAIEAIVGDQFQKMMDTVLNMVETATTGPEVRKAEIEARNIESQQRMQHELMKVMASAFQEGDMDKIESFTRMVTTISGQGSGEEVS